MSSCQSVKLSTYQVIIQECFLLLVGVSAIIALELLIKLLQVSLTHIHILVDNGHQIICHLLNLSQDSHGFLVYLYALHLLVDLGPIVGFLTSVQALVRHNVLNRNSRVLHQTIKIRSHHHGFLKHGIHSLLSLKQLRRCHHMILKLFLMFD